MHIIDRCTSQNKLSSFERTNENIQNNMEVGWLSLPGNFSIVVMRTCDGAFSGE